MKIRFAVQCHNFQHRLAWQLSSISQQFPFAAELSIDVACLAHNGIPTTEAVVATHRDMGLNVWTSLWHFRDRFAKRGIVRNAQLARAISDHADWVFFADCDNVYSPDFFCVLVEHLKMTTATNCIYSKWKDHTEIGATNDHARLVLQSPYIPDAFARADQNIPKIKKGNKPVAAGCMQVCRISDIIKKTNGLYVNPEKTKDSHLFDHGQKAKSDKQFRRAMGGSTSIGLPKQIHLNHARDKEAGYHLEVQR